ncbi:MAG: methyl-accepting chemotaxis protein [Polyangiaceae bacterium]|nr:methyl-accepting chemotaxis protein [Polyangiaceae bacterium]
MMLVMIGLSVFMSVRLADVRENARIVKDDSLPSLDVSSEIEGLSKDIHALTLTHLASSDPEEMADVEREIQAKRAKLDRALEVYGQIEVTEEEERLRADLQRAHGSYVENVDRLIVSSRGAFTPEEQTPLKRNLSELQKVYSAKLREIVEYNRRRGTAAGQGIMAAVDAAQAGLFTGALVAVFLAIVSTFVIVRSIRRALDRPLGELMSVMGVMQRGDFSGRVSLRERSEFDNLADGLNTMADELTALVHQVQRSGIQVNSSATEIASTTRQQQATANEVAATTSEVGATSKAISSTAKQLASTMEEVASVAEGTATLAGTGQTGLSRMETTMRQISEASRSITARLGLLNEKAGNISTIVTTIAKVADQTNLLSLNAAIEAEKAGEYGRGFSVVATEIRRLADQTAIATHDIEQIVKDMQSAVSAGVMGMEKFSDEVRRGVEVIGTVSSQLGDIINSVQTLTPRFEEVREAMTSQATGAEQISEALSQLTEASQQTVESVRSSNIAIEQLNEATRGLQSAVSRFSLRA